MRLTVAGMLVAATLALFPSCAPPPPDTPTAAPAHPSGSVVVLLREAHSGRWEGHCNAFGVRGPGATYLATAAHCVAPGASLGAPVRYASPSGWGHSEARVEWLDRDADLALLSPADPARLAIFARSGPPAQGSRVSAPCALFSTVGRGELVAQEPFSPHPLWLTSVDIERGWSGSPVLDADGAAWGIMSRCPRDTSRAGGCAPHASKAVTLPSL